ncbi:hypothetical protein COV19_02055 [Candidatus Woesearchaeota archaeon CG10_big_fil_rev_8_21_14_0_10_44_13]|nr:MAG: hypothetical protein COV19_02055 [Candidatus Woesearchaeota archaeon CG10_big_fil_rev_8_21_14_0_10_44_13]
MRKLTPTILFFAFFSCFAYAQEGNISVSVERIESHSSIVSIIIMAALMLALLAIFFFLLRYLLLEKKKKRALREKVKVMDKDEADYYKENREDIEKEEKTFSVDEDVDKYLKEDERAVVNILRQRGGICSQSTLRIAGNFSKATLSRLLVELEQRNIIKKEKRGKKNLVILR